MSDLSKSKKELIKVLKKLPSDSFTTHWYLFPLVKGRRASYYFQWCVPASLKQKVAEEVLNKLIEAIKDMDDDMFNGNWNIAIDSDSAPGLRAWFYLGGPGSQPPPFP